MMPNHKVPDAAQRALDVINKATSGCDKTLAAVRAATREVDALLKKLDRVALPGAISMLP